jgi:AraC family transcriptional regulator
MDIWDGNKRDKTNFKTDKYLQINSCGFQCAPKGRTVVREKGRFDRHIILVNSGMLKIVCGGETKLLKKGGFAVYQPEEKQFYTSETDTTTYWIHFGGTAAEEILKSFGIVGGIYETEYSRGVFEAFSKLIRQFNNPSIERFANGSLLTLLVHLSDSVNKIERSEISETISKIITYISMNYNKDFTIDELAKMAGYSKSRFSHLFKEQVKMTPLEYLSEIRLSNACELLTGSKNPIGEVGRSCGFDDQLYFCRVFRKKYGMSPSEYRLRNIGTEQ